MSITFTEFLKQLISTPALIVIAILNLGVIFVNRLDRWT